MWARAAYDSGLQYVQQEKYADALKSFKRALETQPDFLDAHLWVARVSEDMAERRKHLGEVLARSPSHSEAIRELMLLNEEITEEEAARSANPAYDPQRLDAPAPVSVRAATLSCPKCGGELTLAPNSTQAICAYCGYTEKARLKKDIGMKSVSMELIRKRGQEVVWAVGEHLLQCKTCGAERTFPPGKIAARCPFCSSKHIIQKDALASFQQPDGVIPFATSEAQALEKLQQALNSRFERFKSLFANNSVKQTRLEGLFLPCWYFDTVLQVTRTIHEKSSRYEKPMPARQENLTEMANDVMVFGVKSPAPHLLEQLGQYDLAPLVPYTPELLASYSAEIYTLDFDAASLQARGQISQQMREFHGYTDDPFADVSVTVHTLVQQMAFRLLLLPVWIATLLEQDGDIRPALVNGQTGSVVLGKARKP
jgi:tetratricopeptide (TPR) repeat protein